MDCVVCPVGYYGVGVVAFFGDCLSEWGLWFVWYVGYVLAEPVYDF